MSITTLFCEELQDPTESPGEASLLSENMIHVKKNMFHVADDFLGESFDMIRKIKW